MDAAGARCAARSAAVARRVAALPFLALPCPTYTKPPPRPRGAARCLARSLGPHRCASGSTFQVLHFENRLELRRRVYAQATTKDMTCLCAPERQMCHPAASLFSGMTPPTTPNRNRRMWVRFPNAAARAVCRVNKKGKQTFIFFLRVCFFQPSPETFPCPRSARGSRESGGAGAAADGACSRVAAPLA